MSTLDRISLTIESDLLEHFDGWLEATGQASRSEAIRDLVRNRLVEESLGDDSTMAVATVTILYDHRQRELSDRLVEAGHAHNGMVLVSTHVHIDRHHCLEMLALRGRRGELKRLADELIGMKGVKHGRAFFTTVSQWTD